LQSYTATPGEGKDELGPVPSPHANLFYLWYKGREYYMNSFKRLMKNRSRWAPGEWSFEARTSEVSVQGTIKGANENMAGVTYTDPDGGKLWCNNSKVADVKLVVRTEDDAKNLACDKMCAAEFVDLRIYPQVPIRI